MGNGMLAQWRRGMVARGLATAALLAIPVAVAAAIGFKGSLGGLYDGLAAVVSGPDSSQGRPAATASDADPAAATEPARGSAAPARANRGGGADGGGTVVVAERAAALPRAVAAAGPAAEPAAASSTFPSAAGVVAAEPSTFPVSEAAVAAAVAAAAWATLLGARSATW